MVLSIVVLDLALGVPGLALGGQGLDPVQDQGQLQVPDQGHVQGVLIKECLKGTQDPGAEANHHPKLNQRGIDKLLVEVLLEGPAQEVCLQVMINLRGQHPGAVLQQDQVIALNERTSVLIQIVDLLAGLIIQGVHHQAKMGMEKETNLVVFLQIETERMSRDAQKADHQLGLVSQNVHFLVVNHHVKETTLLVILKVANLAPKACHLQETNLLKVIGCQALVVLIQ